MTDEMAAALVPIGHVDALGPCAYTEHAPPDGAPPAVARIWRSEVRETGLLHVVPDGCVELVRGADGVVEIWGPAYRPRRVALERGAAYDGVRIRAGAGPAVLGVPAADLAGMVVPAAELGSWGRPTGRERWLTGVLARAAAATDPWRRDVVAFRGPGLLARPGARIAQVGVELGLGERQLRRRFERSIGLSPSAYRRLARARYALRDLSRPRPGPPDTIAAIAYRRGFTDQSHLTREVVALTGLTPARLR